MFFQTVSLDAPRFIELGTQVYRLVVIASLMLVSPTCGTDNTAIARHKHMLKDKLHILLDNTANDM